MKFDKWQALGNDFILVDTQPCWTPETVCAVCDRHTGIGADGVLFLERQPVRMTILNADGSRPEMCGNGLRCAAAFLLEAGEPGWAPSKDASVATDAGERACRVTVLGGGTFEVRIDMGVVRMEGILDDPEGAGPFLRVNVGNPHLVSFDRPRSMLASLGPRLERALPGRANVELVERQSDGSLSVAVWERGVGPTQACGTGACAVVAAACATERAPFDREIEVALPGGVLRVLVEKATMRAWMTGPATRVYRGELMNPPR